MIKKLVIRSENCFIKSKKTIKRKGSDVLFNANTSYAIALYIKRVIQRGIVLFNTITWYPMRKRDIQSENKLFNAKTYHPAQTCYLTQKCAIQRENSSIQHENMLPIAKKCYLTRKLVIQSGDLLSNAKSCYQTRKSVIQRGNLSSTAETCYPMRKHVFWREK